MFHIFCYDNRRTQKINYSRTRPDELGNEAFSWCSGLTSVTIGNSVTSIGQNAFYGADIPTVVSLIENPFTIEGKTSGGRTFTQNTFLNATLYVPKGTIEKYKATEGWKDFVFIEEGEGPGGDTPLPPTPEIKKCATPSISYSNGQLKFGCETEGVEYQSIITDTDIKDYTAGVIDLNVTYNISVYATKEGYKDSDVATATLCWIDAEPWAEGTKEAEDNVTEVKAMPVLIQAEGNIISIQGAAEGTEISVYNTSGNKLSSTIANNGITTLKTTLQTGSTAIVKIGEKSVKVLVR
ncbi:MAG: leucine-rich repeat protein [Bacteroidaceae bacterium]|nr:leucine-rich repeat protein [Bacteroidaceae bacterium]